MTQPPSKLPPELPPDVPQGPLPIEVPGNPELSPDPAREGRVRQRIPRTLRGRVFAAGALVLLTALVGTGLGFGPFANKDYRGGHGAQVTVRVRPGDSLSAIGRSLHAANVVKDVGFFVRTASSDDRATRVQPGYYAMYEHMRSRDAFVRFFNPAARVKIKVLVPAGARTQAILDRLSDRTGIPVIDFQSAVHAWRPKLPAYADGDIEGMLWPATYYFDPDATARGIIAELVTTAQREHQRLRLLEPSTHHGMSARQVLTLASIVQVEAYPKDYAKVARVVMNRLDRGQKLQLDSTLNYALGTAKWAFTSTEHRNPSPYNTFVHRGLPVGPIGNPDAAAINAALHPADGPWVFFVTTNPDTGLTEFASTEAEFLKLRRKFQQWLASK